MRTPLLSLLLLATSLGAQKVADSLNENQPVTYFTTAQDWFCIKRPLTAPLVLSALQFPLSGANASQVDVGVFDEDPATGKPRTLLGSGTATLTPGVPGWTGAKFTTPIVITASGNYFTGVKMVSGVQLGMSRTGTITPHWFSPSTGWNGPFPSYAWLFRLYAGNHTGAYVNYGTGQAGSGSAVPALRGLGWPNTTNTIELQVSQGLGAAPVGFLFGPRVAIPLALGTLYAIPLVIVPSTLVGGAPGVGHATLSLAIPNDPSLNGGVVATQAWILDAGAATGFSHTGGLEITVGH